MAGKGRITVLILVIAAFAVAGCDSLLEDGIGGGGLVSSSSVYDGLSVSPKRQTYSVGERLQRNADHLEVFATRGDERRAVSLDDCEIRVIGDIGKPEEYDLVPASGGYLFDTPGTKLIQVYYNKLSGQYSISVNEGSSESDQTGIIIEWVS